MLQNVTVYEQTGKNCSEAENVFTTHDETTGQAQHTPFTRLDE